MTTLNSISNLPRIRYADELEENENDEKNLDQFQKKLIIPGEAIKCFCRLRSTETLSDIYKIQPNTDNKILSIKMDQNTVQKFNGITSFTFTRIFDEQADQNEVYQSTCRNLIDDMFKSRKGGLIFTYGMTNSGKTYTIVGEISKEGILPRALKDIYENIDKLEQKPSITCNFVEIYNEEMFDLLTNDPKNPKYKKKVLIKEREKKFVFQDITNFKIENLEDFNEALRRGIYKKTHSTTLLNINSSRSHTIFKILLNFPGKNKENENETEEVTLSIVDLAGSERNNRTETQGKEFQEACKINQSLMVLGKCMESLRFNSITSSKKIVPFRESKLTMIFQEYFQGNQNIIMITNINPRKEDFEESMRALKYSCIAKEIRPVQSKIITFNKKKTLKQADEIEEPDSDEKNICKNLNEIFSEVKENVQEHHQLDFSSGYEKISMSNFKDDIEALKNEIYTIKQKLEENEVKCLEKDYNFDRLYGIYEETREELKIRELYGRQEAYRDIFSKKIENNKFSPLTINTNYENSFLMINSLSNENVISFTEDKKKVLIKHLKPPVTKIESSKESSFSLNLNITESKKISVEVIETNKEDQIKTESIEKNVGKNEDTKVVEYEEDLSSITNNTSNLFYDSDDSIASSINKKKVKSKKNNAKTKGKKKITKVDISPIPETKDDSFEENEDKKLTKKGKTDKLISKEVKIDDIDFKTKKHKKNLTSTSLEIEKPKLSEDEDDKRSKNSFVKINENDGETIKEDKPKKKKKTKKKN